MGGMSADTQASLSVHPDRLLPAQPEVRDVARRIYATTKDLPITSPHSHVPPQWLVDDEPWPDPASLLLTPDHYVLRLLHANGAELSDLGRGPEGPLPLDEAAARKDRKSTRLNSSHVAISYAVFCLKKKKIDGR